MNGMCCLVGIINTSIEDNKVLTEMTVAINLIHNHS